MIRPRPGAIRVTNAGAADDDRAGREVGPPHVLHQVLDVRVGLVDQLDDRVGHLAEAVRRDVRRHADGDSRRAVDEQVGEPRREGSRLTPRLVVVRREVDRVRVDVAEHLRRQTRQPAFRVPHRGRRVVVDVAEVALAVHQRVAQGERLRHPHERVVDRRVPVRMEALHHLTDDGRALDAGPVRLEPGLVHRVEDAAVHGLEPVPDVRKGPRHDHAHRVVEEARTHLLLELSRLDPAGAEGAARVRAQTSRNFTSFAFCSMNRRRGST